MRMQSIQDAYNGFAKQNYTMLDNLKIGYGGTQAEMKRLIKEAAAMTDTQKELGVTVDSNSMSYANIVQAIHVVQANMGIMGTTSKEAATTIQGSTASMKSAWENLLIGIADPEQDFQALVDNLVDSVITAGNNIIPRIKEIVPYSADKLVAGIVGDRHISLGFHNDLVCSGVVYCDFSFALKVIGLFRNIGVCSIGFGAAT